MEPVTIEATRLSLWLVPAVSSGFLFLIMLGLPDAGGRIFYAVMLLAALRWTWGARRVGITASPSELEVRTSFRTHRFRWSAIAEALVVPMATRSPFAGRWPYVAVALRLHDGGEVRFDDLSEARDREPPGRVGRIVDLINARASER